MKTRKPQSPHAYRATGGVQVARRNVTAEAMRIVRDQWIAVGIDRDTAAEVMAVAKGRSS